LKGPLQALRKCSQNHQQLISRGKQDYHEFQGKEHIFCSIFEKACDEKFIVGCLEKRQQVCKGNEQGGSGRKHRKWRRWGIKYIVERRRRSVCSCLANPSAE